MKFKISVVILSLIFAFISTGFSKPHIVEAPKITSIGDLPADDGRGVVLMWTHFTGSPLYKYEIYRGTDPQKMKKVGVKNYQLAPKEVVIDSANYVADMGYYLRVVSDGGNIPVIKLMKESEKTEDAEKIIWVETKLVLATAGGYEPRYARGEFYKMRFKKQVIEEPKIIELKGYGVKDELGKKFLVPDDKIIRLYLDKSKRAVDFINRGELIQEASAEFSDLQKEFGERITAFITDKGRRYSLIYFHDQYVDIDTLITPGTRYYYKIRAVFGYKKYVESDTISVVPEDNMPTPPVLLKALYDTSKGEGIVVWNAADSDIRYVTFVKIDSDSGKVRAKVHGSWNAIKVVGLSKEDLNSNYKLVVIDKAEQKAESAPFRFKFESILSPPDFPPNIIIEDNPNDDATSIRISFGEPELELSYVSLNIIPAPRFELFDGIEGLYISPEKNGLYELLREEKGKVIPEDYQRIIKAEIASKPLPTSPFDILVSYNKQVRSHDDVGFVKLQLDSFPPEVDFTDDGRFVMSGVKEGHHTITGWILTRSGKPIESTKRTISFSLPEELEGYAGQEPYQIEVYRGKTENPSEFEKIIVLPSSMHEYVDKISTKPVKDTTFYYFLRVLAPDGNFNDTRVFGPVRTKDNVFHVGKFPVLLILLVFLGISLYFLLHAQRGKTFYIRPIAGINHIDEALGRATEMGRPILYVLGLDGIASINTLAGLTILGRVARKAAEYQLRVIVPAYDPLTMLVAQETVRSSFTDAGRPDLFNPGDIFFVTDSQFAYAAAVSGIMVRERTAANFYMGGFYAESLLLAESGASTGAIQIAGSDAMTQLPFFITTCDYTLMGEELYAASAYLSRDPAQVASLKIQDLNKLIIMIIMLLGIVLISVGWHSLYNFFLVKI